MHVCFIARYLWRFDSLGHYATNPKSLPPFVQTQRDDDDDSMKQIVEM